MPREPNYKFERFERDRKKAAKKAERAEQEPGAVDEIAVIEEDATD